MKTTLLVVTVFAFTTLEKFKVLATRTATTTVSSSVCDTHLPIRALANISASSAEEVIVPNEIEISWRFECDLQQSLIRQFSIEYCRLPDCLSNQKESLAVLTLRNSHNLTSYSLSQLTPNSTYQIIFSSPEIATKYELYGRTDISLPDPPTDIRLNFEKDITLPVLSWDLAVDQNNIDYFYVTVSELLTREYIFISDKINKR